MVHRNTDIHITVIENRTETVGYRSILFERPEGFNYESGDWVDIQFGEQVLRGGKTYSLSSSPTEPYLMITFKNGLSQIKNALASLVPGDRLRIIRYGNDNKFTLKQHKPGVLIAGGVGVAPFRSMIKEMLDTKATKEIVLVYLNKTPDLLFRTELEDWLGKLTHVSMVTIFTASLKKKDRVKAMTAALGGVS